MYLYFLPIRTPKLKTYRNLIDEYLAEEKIKTKEETNLCDIPVISCVNNNNKYNSQLSYYKMSSKVFGFYSFANQELEHLRFYTKTKRRAGTIQ